MKDRRYEILNTEKGNDSKRKVAPVTLPTLKFLTKPLLPLESVGRKRRAGKGRALTGKR